MRLPPRACFDDAVNRADLAAIVKDYRSRHRRVALAELEYFSSRASDEEAVSEAVLSRINGKKLSHQRRLPSAVLAEASRRVLDNLEGLRVSQTFDELFEQIDAIVGTIVGIGDLAVYDFALRIGVRFGLAPDRVYLHAGTRDGARALGLDWRRKTLELSELPVALRELTAREAEDVLCIYKSSLDNGRPVDAERGCGPRIAMPRKRC